MSRTLRPLKMKFFGIVISAEHFFLYILMNVLEHTTSHLFPVEIYSDKFDDGIALVELTIRTCKIKKINWSSRYESKFKVMIIGSELVG